MPICHLALQACTQPPDVSLMLLNYEMPSNPSAQQLIFSDYKHHNTLKVFIGITPSGTISFISNLYGENISDKKLTLASGLLDLLESGDAIVTGLI